jgi:hypothetical protein
MVVLRRPLEVIAALAAGLRAALHPRSRWGCATSTRGRRDPQPHAGAGGDPAQEDARLADAGVLPRPHRDLLRHRHLPRPEALLVLHEAGRDGRRSRHTCGSASFRPAASPSSPWCSRSPPSTG